MAKATLLDRIAKQRALVLDLADQKADATRKLAELVAATKDDPDPTVNPSSAARAMGVSKGWAHQLVAKLDAGKL